jgi:hypothetical protein
MRSKFILAVISSILLLIMATPGLAQEPDQDFEISLRRDWGFGMGGTIQGRFTLRAHGPDNLIEVRYLLDGQLMGAVTDPPFSLQFHTDDYPTGVHEIYAVGIVEGGGEIHSQTLSLQFISGEEAGGSVTRFIVPLVIAILVVSVLSAVLPSLLGRGKDRFELGQYGSAGGAVCPACALPYSRHLMSPNLVLGKLSRCPHCGKWAIARRATAAELEMAEARYRQDQHQGQARPPTEADDLHRQLEESRFED